MELFIDILIDAMLDSLKMLPFLFGAYLLMEWLEHRSGEGMEKLLARARRLGPFTGALLGCVPQCGFSVAAANLYAGGVITVGTLLAVFLSTSDEAVPLLLGAPEGLATLLPLLGLKVVAGILVGTAVDWTAALLARRRPPVEEELHRICRRCGCEEEGILSAALRHTGSVFLFILLVNLALGWGVAMLGEDRLAALLLAEQAKRAEKKERNWWELDLVQKEEQEENGAGQELKKQRICQRIAARIMAGDKVPPEDLQYLMGHDLQSYQLAMAARVPKEHPKEWKSALEKEKQPSDAASQEGEAASDGGGAPEVSGGETV